MGKRHKQRFFQRRHKDDQQAHEKMCNISNYQRNANQNYHDIPPHTGQNGHHRKSPNQKCWRESGENGTLLDCWWEWKLVQPVWKMVWSFLRELSLELPYDLAIKPLGLYVDRTFTERHTCTPMFIVALFTMAKTWK